MNLSDRIAKRQLELQREKTARASAKAASDSHNATQIAMSQLEGDARKALASTFCKWALLSGIKPTNMRRRVAHRKSIKVKGWNLITISTGTYETHNGRPPTKTLILYVDGVAEWSNHGIADTRASLAELEYGIVNFVAASGSKAPWPD